MISYSGFMVYRNKYLVIAGYTGSADAQIFAKIIFKGDVQ